MIRFISILVLFTVLTKNLCAQSARFNDSLKLDSLSELMYKANDNQKFDTAIIYAKEIVALTLTLYGSSSAEYIGGLSDLGYLYNANFDFLNAEYYDKEAIKLLEKNPNRDDTVYSNAINNLGTNYETLGNYSLADSLYKKSLLIRRKIYGDTSAEYAESLNNIGVFYLKTENYDLAKPTLEKSLAIREKSLGKNEKYAQTLNTLALVIQKTGNYALAETKYKEALAIIDSCCGKIIEYWNINNNLASLYFDMGNYTAAETIHKKVLAHILNDFHKKIVDYATTLGLLAKDYSTAGDYDSALIFLKEASEFIAEQLSQNHPDYATNLGLIASVYEKKNELDSAEFYFHQALEIRKDNLGETSSAYAETLNALGEIALKKKDFLSAQKKFHEAADIRFNSLGNQNTDYAESINNLLNVSYSANNYTQWREALDTALVIWKNSITHLLLSFGEKEKEAYLNNHLLQRDVFLSMLWYFNQHHYTDSLNGLYFKMITALQGWLLSGSQELNAVVMRTKDTALLTMYNQWLSLKTKYAQAIQMNAKQQQMLHLNTDSLLQAINDLERSIINQLPELQQSLNNTGILPSVVAAKLGKDDVVVNWVSFKYKNPQQWTDSVLYAAFIITQKDTVPKFIIAFEQKQLQQLLTYYFNYSGRGVTIKSLDTNKTVGTELYKLIWQPILPYVKAANKVFIIPSGLLNKISFQSLSDTSSKTLLETTEIHLLNNINEINNTASNNPINKTINVFGGADFNRTSTGATFNHATTGTWQYLKGSAEEANEVAALFKKNNWNVSLYTGLTATEENLKKLSGLNSPAILHIATHGYYLPVYFNDSSANKNLQQNFPLLKSGFVLSGANIYWQNDTALINGEDGIVTAQEIANLNFSNTKLLILSACETALGDINNNEGVYGLQRAFKIAGVKEMLITLWQIPDEETRQLMNLFYQNVFNGDSYFNALRKAQLKMKEHNSNPAIWAGFELIGE